MELDTLIPNRPRWMARSACAGRGIEPFFPTPGADSSEARAICAGCPVQAECLEFALADRTVDGIWAGTDDKDRRRIRRERRQAA
ncbi:MAG: WhiB family transcriptional regulator [Acidimicrobiia bacterium]